MTFDLIIDAIAERGWSVTPGFLPDEALRALVEEEHSLWEEGRFREAGVGAGGGVAVRPEIRSDRILWLDPSGLAPAVGAYWQTVDALRRQLNRALYLGLQDFEAHFAVYPPGSFYRRHLDQHQTASRRMISCILYLNREWQAEDGGQLRIYDGERLDAYTEVLPEYGTFACFRSDTVYHEVFPAGRERFSLTGWLRRAG